MSINTCVKKFSTTCYVRNSFNNIHYKNHQIKEHCDKNFHFVACDQNLRRTTHSRKLTKCHIFRVNK